MINGIEAQFGTAHVVATAQITESNFMGRKRWTHARKGDRGEVVHRETAPDGVETLTVLFTRSGTSALVFAGGNVRLVERERTSTPAERLETSARMARAARRA